MDYRIAAETFLRKHHMHPDNIDINDFCRAFTEDMAAGLAGRPSSMGMFPAYLSCESEPQRETPVLVVDAGGTNLRCARMHFTADGSIVTDSIRKSRMPGTRGEVDVTELFDTIAREIMAVGADCELACISFSYPCEVLPNGDGRVIRLTKELHVTNLVGSTVCEPLEKALKKLGAPGTRRWRLINDTVGTLLGGMAQCDRSRYDGFVGLILGTGTNTCASFPAADISKSPAAVAMGGQVVVNLESGGFDRFTLGSADDRLDANSTQPGKQRLEKTISGGYYHQLLRQTLLLAVEEGVLHADAEAIRSAWIDSPAVDRLCGDEANDTLFPRLLGTERPFAHHVNALLLERAAKLTACTLASIILYQNVAPGSRICICSDGTTIAKNPLLRPLSEKYLAEVLAPRGIHAEYFQVSDATLLGSAYAGLL